MDFNIHKYKKTMKLKGEVGMGGPKSIQTRFVGIIMSTIHPNACFFRLCMATIYIYMPVDDDSLVLSLTKRN